MFRRNILILFLRYECNFYLKRSLLWEITQQMCVVGYRRFETAWLRYLTTNLRRVTSKKSENLNHIAVKAWYIASFICFILFPYLPQSFWFPSEYFKVKLAPWPNNFEKLDTSTVADHQHHRHSSALVGLFLLAATILVIFNRNCSEIPRVFAQSCHKHRSHSAGYLRYILPLYKTRKYITTLSSFKKTQVCKYDGFNWPHITALST
jgi:hypothetical protein